MGWAGVHARQLAALTFMSLLQIIAIPVLLILPGAACLRMFVRPRGAVWFLSLPLSVPFTSMALFLLGATSMYSLRSIVAVDLLLTALLWMFRTRSVKPFLGVLEQRFCAALAILFAVAFWYDSPPFEYYFGGRDPGIYVVDGIRMARAGSIEAKDPLITQIDANHRKLFFSDKIPVRYMGFQIEKDSDGVVVANFFHLFPLWEALFYLLFGVHAMLYVTPYLACCLLAALALLIRLVQGEAEALGAFLLLGASPVFFWFSRFPNSEMIAGSLIFLGLLFLESYRRNSHFGAGILGALCLGLAFWARVDAALLGTSLFLFLAFLWMGGASMRSGLTVLAVYILFVVVNVEYMVHTNPDYLSGTFYNLRFKIYKVVGVLAAAGGVIAALAYAGRRFHVAQSQRAGKILAFALALLLLYAYFIRPYYPASNIGSPNAGALLALGWYFTHPIVLLALVGLILYAYSFRTIHWVLFSATLIYSALYFYRIRAFAEHYWMLRRYLPVICPALAFYAVYAARRILQKIPVLRPRASALILVGSILLAGWYVYDSRAIYKHNEYQGSFRFMEGIANRLAPADLLILGARDANDLHIVGPMLSYYFDRNVLQLRDANPNLPLLAEFLRSWKGRIYFAGTGNSNLASAEFFLHPIEQLHFDTPVFDEIYHARPRTALTKTFDVGLYGVQKEPRSDPYFVDVGKYDDGSIISFHLKEQFSGIDYRWTNGAGHVFFPPSSSPLRSVALRLNPGPWVPGMPRVHAKISANGILLVDLILLNGYNTYEVPVPAAAQAQLTGVPVDVLIESKSWIPKRVLNLPDLRRVGVIVDWVRLQH